MKAKTKKVLESILSHTEDKLSEAQENHRIYVGDLEIYPYENEYWGPRQRGAKTFRLDIGMTMPRDDEDGLFLEDLVASIRNVYNVDAYVSTVWAEPLNTGELNVGIIIEVVE